MSSENRSREHRKSCRFPVIDSRQSCELRIGSHVLSAQLLDESAGGFSILVNRLSSDVVNQTAQLRTDSGCYSVRVVHVMQVRPKKADAAILEQGPWFRMGLRRLGEIAQIGEPSTSVLAGSLWFRLNQWCPASGMFVAFGVFAAIVAVALSIGQMVATWHTGAPTVMQRPQAGPRSVERPTSVKSPRNALAEKSVSDANRRPMQESSTSTASDGAYRNSLHRLPGADAFTLPEVVRELNLTADQQKQIGQLIDATLKAMRSLNEQFRGQQRQLISQRRTELLDRARLEAVKLLTDQQRAQWQKLSGEK